MLSLRLFIPLKNMETSLELFEQTVDAYNSEVSDIYKFSFTAKETEMFTEMMIEFAKNHVTEALKQAGEKSKIDIIPVLKVSNINRDEILEAYSLDNVV
jgi:hypothetical protein